MLSLLWIRAIGFCHFVDILENSASQFFSKLQVGNPGSEPADCLWSRPAHAVLAVSSPPLSLYIPTYLVFLTCECLCLGKNLLCQVDRRYMVDFSKFIVSNNILAIHALLLPYVWVRIANMQRPRLVLEWGPSWLRLVHSRIIIMQITNSLSLNIILINFDPRNEKKIYTLRKFDFFLSNF